MFPWIDIPPDNWNMKEIPGKRLQKQYSYKRFFLYVTIATVLVWFSHLNLFFQVLVTPINKTCNDEASIITNKKDNEEDTAIFITTSWIPAHPSTDIIDMTINSTVHILGLSPTAPIFITIDHLLEPSAAVKREKLDEYVFNLYSNYLTKPNVHILASLDHQHIGGNVFKAIRLVQKYYPFVEFVYSLQHDFDFIRDISHSGLVKAMRDYEHINYIRFKYKKHEINPTCGNVTPGNETLYNIQGSNATIFHTRKYSDNNHLVRFSWYLSSVIGVLGFFKRSPEGPMMYKADKSCEELGLFTYGKPDGFDPPVIRHLDGRHTHF